MSETVTLWRPVGPRELKLIEDSDWRAFPPRLPEQPIFYPVTTREYAIKIARDWNVARQRKRLRNRVRCARRFPCAVSCRDCRRAGPSGHWIPAEDLPKFNDAIVGQIRVVDWFPPT
jgi:hypothetical protein